MGIGFAKFVSPLPVTLQGLAVQAIPIGRRVVPFWGPYFEFYKIIPKRNYFGAYG